MTRGEVWWARDGDKRRPFLILTRTSAVELVNRLIVVPTTSTVRGIRTEVPLTRRDGMPSRCVLSLDNTRSLRKTQLLEHITTLSADRMDEVCAALRIATGCGA